MPGRLPGFGEAPKKAPSASSPLGVLHLHLLADAAGGEVPDVRVAAEDEDDFRHDPCEASEASQHHTDSDGTRK